jgi:hypothetical protein
MKFFGIWWPPLAELRAKFEAKFGPQTWLYPDITEWEPRYGHLSGLDTSVAQPKNSSPLAQPCGKNPPTSGKKTPNKLKRDSKSENQTTLTC